MSSPSTRTVALSAHPDAGAGAIRAVRARLSRRARGMLGVNYILEGDLERVRIPALASSRRADRLWEHTCCELFVARKNENAYHEFNFAPSGEWAVYAFERYRSPAATPVDAAAVPIAPVAVRRSPTRLEIDVSIRLDRLSPQHANAALSLAVAAIIEERDGALAYWALAHPPGKPDFHHRDAFALTFDEVRH